MHQKYEKFIDMVTDSTLQLTFKTFVKIWCNLKNEYPQLLDIFPFSSSVSEYSWVFLLDFH